MNKIEQLKKDKSSIEQNLQTTVKRLSELSQKIQQTAKEQEKDTLQEEKKELIKQIEQLEIEREDIIKELLILIKTELETAGESIKQQLQQEIQKYEREEWENQSYYIGVIEMLEKETDHDTKTLKQKISIQENIEDKRSTISTYEILQGTTTEERLKKVLENPIFLKYGETPEKRLEYIFNKINETIHTYLNWKFNIPKEDKNYKVITQVLTPAIEWYLMDFLRQNQHENNVSDLSSLNTISLDSFTNIVSGLGKFATKATSTFNKGKALIKAIDFLSIQHWTLQKPTSYEVLRNPKKCKEFLDNFIAQEEINSEKDIYEISAKEVGLIPTTENNFWMTDTEKKEIQDLIGNIQVVDSPTTTKYIFAMVDKAKPFLLTRNTLADQAMGLLDIAEGSLWAFWKLVGFDILAEIQNSKIMKGVIDTVLSLLGFTGWFEGLLKKWYNKKIEKELDENKREQINKMFNTYMNATGQKEEKNSLKNNIPNVKKLPETSKTYFDIDMPILSKSINKDLDWSQINPKVLQTLPKTKDFDPKYYLKTVEKNNNGKRTKEQIIDPNKQAELEVNKEKIINNYIAFFTNHLADPNKNKKYLNSIDSSDKVVFTIISSLYISSENVVDGVAAKVFLPQEFIGEGYNNKQENKEDLTNNNDASVEIKWYNGNLMFYDKIPWTESEKKAFKQKVEEISKDLNINPNWLMAVMYKESAGSLSPSIQNSIGATGLIQFMPNTAKWLWTTIEKLKQMTAVQQLDYVKKYYEGWTYNSMKDLYLKTFFPVALNHSDNKNYIFQANNLSAQTVAKKNPAISKGKSQITMKDFDSYIANIKMNNIPSEFQNQFA